MNFLDKLYESNYFGIGLFAVISFLVVTFLIVLFFGKRDEKRRRLESTKELEKTSMDNAFKETSVPTPIEVPVVEASDVAESVMPVMPIEESTPSILEAEPIIPIVNEEPIAPINYNSEPVIPVAPVNNDYEPRHFVEIPKEETISVDIPAEPIINEAPAPIITEPIKNVEPIKLETTIYDIPAEPKVIEPIRITIPEEPINSTPVIEDVKPIVTPVISDVTPTIVEPVVTDTYYKPIEKPKSEEVNVPSIDFDALAKSISDELDELENSSNNYHEEVKVTPINEVVSKPATQFSSVYVSEPTKPVVTENVELPKKIDLPAMKTNDIEPENYNI